MNRGGVREMYRGEIRGDLRHGEGCFWENVQLGEAARERLVWRRVVRFRAVG